MSTQKTAVLALVIIVVLALGISFSDYLVSPISALAFLASATPTIDAASGRPDSTATPPVAFPKLSLKPGDSYFSVDGKQSFIFSRNVAAYYQRDYDILLIWAKRAGTRVVRVGLDNMVMGGYGYTKSGEIIETWAANWERLFDNAEAAGIYILPFFTGWVNWNTSGYNTWDTNPFNAKNGGPATYHLDLFQTDSSTQQLYLKWLKDVITRWQGHKNILAWEVYSEVNFTNGITETAGVTFVERAAAVVREADLNHRPITASLADVGEWPSFYRSSAVEFINFHPYPLSGKLDTYIIQEVRRYAAKYNKPVLIGESGLNAATPDSTEGKITVAPNAPIGIRHAVWAAMVAGAMNGRALWWEDGYGIYFEGLSWPFLQKYAEIELPAARFISDVAVAGFKPLAAQMSGKIVGAALGNEKMGIGWFRDANCEPLDWQTQPVISKQSVIITVAGSSSNWIVDFYSTATGTDILKSIQVVRKGNTLTIPLPDFTDDIAFKFYVKP